MDDHSGSNLWVYLISIVCVCVYDVDMWWCVGITENVKNIFLPSGVGVGVGVCGVTVQYSVSTNLFTVLTN